MQQGERKGHSFQNRMHALAIFLSPKNSQPTALAATTSLPKAKPANPAACISLERRRRKED
jgi:hypothetical protein